MAKARSECSKLLREEVQKEEATVSCKEWLQLKETSVDAAGVAALSEVDGIFTV